MSRYVLGREVALDLEAIWEFIAQDKPAAADRWITTLFDAFERIANTPGIGHKRQDLTSHPILFWPVNEYLILYRQQMAASKSLPSRRAQETSPNSSPVANDKVCLTQP